MAFTLDSYIRPWASRGLTLRPSSEFSLTLPYSLEILSSTLTLGNSLAVFFTSAVEYKISRYIVVDIVMP